VSTAARLERAARFLAALSSPDDAAASRLKALLHPQARFMTLGREGEGAEAVASLVLQGPNGELARRLDWSQPEPAGDQVHVTGTRREGTRDRGLVIVLGFEGDAISLVQQQRTPPPPPEAQPIVLPEDLRRMVNHALVERHPMLVAYTDPEGQPVLSFRGSVQVDGDDRLAMWIRSSDGDFIRAIRRNPRVALVYRNEDTKATYNFQGRARVSDSPDDRRRIFEASPQAERAHDFAMLGVSVIVELDKVEGYAGLGPAGQVDQIRMLRDRTAV
jgi:hypothetical protein